MSNQHNPEQVVDQLPGEERGMPSVNETGPSTAKRGLIVIILLLIACAAGGVGYWKYKKNAAKANEAAAQKNLQLTSAVPARTFVLAPSAPAEAAPPLPGAAVPVVPAPAGAAPAPALPGNANAGATMANGKPMPVLDKSGSSLMAVASKSVPKALHPEAAANSALLVAWLKCSLRHGRERARPECSAIATSSWRRAASSTAHYKPGLIQRCPA
jgi:type IV secretion system protein VirB10